MLLTTTIIGRFIASANVKTQNSKSIAIPSPQFRRFLGFCLIIIVWFVLVLTGFLLLCDYSTRPGASAAVPTKWPENSTLPQVDGRQSLLFFIHPCCPCSMASLNVFERILVKTASSQDATVVLTGGVEPNQKTRDWFQNWCQKRNVRLVWDFRREEAEIFHVKTSGQTILYNKNGSLVFSGGITAGRGHAGDNPGQQDLQAAIHVNGSDQATAKCHPLYGCSIWEETNE
ncbi:hypothetical protein [uncultured Rubinisphaera sp.]|uniref:hypothetical protein n=1 Tax=uncultured Rubinisphaera sp. TaxID=1678686 RepID=UPI000ECE6BEC|nr:hypothetical protein [Planctomycetaceae bacterium]|tara:strand:- start:73 stop:762 length:690 start_codon:yes stop_codon:yes gene_type:complete